MSTHRWSKMLIAAGMFVIAGAWVQSAMAQVVILPSRTQFSVNTTVRVPDGGTMRLGGVGSSTSGSVSRSTPLAGNIPGLGRLARNRATGTATGATYASVSAQVLVMSELEQEVLAEATRRQAMRLPTSPPPEVQRRAEFLSQNMGRSTPRR